MQNPLIIPQIPNPIPLDLPINESEHAWLSELSEPLFKILNEKHPTSINLSSDQILVLAILIQRANPNTKITPEQLIPIILKTINLN